MIQPKEYKELYYKYCACRCTQPNCCDACQAIIDAGKLIKKHQNNFGLHGLDANGKPVNAKR